MKKTDKPIKMFDLPIFSNSKSSLLSLVRSHLANSRETAYIFTPNPEQVVMAQHQPEFKAHLLNATWLLPDGIGLVWASRWLTAFRGDRADQITERISGREVVAELLTWPELAKERVLIVGGRDYAETKLGHWQIQAATSSHTASDYRAQSGKTIWWTPGYQTVSQPQSAESASLRTVIEVLKPSVILVAFGAPYQEKWVNDHQAWFVKNQVKIVMVVGGAFDVLTGRLAAPPVWMSQVGLEWFFRLLQQPQRLGRQLRLIEFGWLVCKACLLGK